MSYYGIEIFCVGEAMGSTDDWTEELVKAQFPAAFAREAADKYLRYANEHPWEAVNRQEFGKNLFIKATKEKIKAALQDFHYNKALNDYQETANKLAEFKGVKPAKGLQKYHYERLQNKLAKMHRPNPWDYIPDQQQIDHAYHFRNRYDFSHLIGSNISAHFYNPIPLIGEKKAFKRRGCDFQGILQIAEFENEEYYIPDSSHCSFKSVNKAAELEGWTERIKYPMKHLDLATSKFINSKIKEVFEWNKVPKYAIWNDEKKCFRATQDGHKSSSKFVILGIELVPGSREYHDILCKIPEAAESLKKHSKSWTPKSYDDIVKLIKLEKSKKLSEMQVKIRQPTGRKYIDVIFIYDIETYCGYYIKKTGIKTGSSMPVMQFSKEEVLAMSEDESLAWMLIPIALAFKRININDEKKVIVEDKEVLVGENCWEQFIDILAKEKDLPLSKIKGQKAPVPTIYLYGHNAGKFDHLYSKGQKKLKFLDQIEGSTIKMLQAKIENSENIIIMHDSLLFTQASLENSAKFFNTPRKIKFDIENMTREDYMLSEIIPQEEIDFPNDTKEQRQWKIERRQKRGWKQYLKRDVECLAEIMKKLERYLRNFGCSASNHCGIPGVAWDVMNNDCYWMKDVHISIDSVTCNFIRQAIMGGRLLHWMKLINWRYEDIQRILNNEKVPEQKEDYAENDVFIALDANSLYPSAMQIGQFSVGKFKILPNPKSEDLVALIRQKKMFMAEVEFHPQNVRYPLIPFKTPDGNLIYPANHKFMYKGQETTFRGVYTSVEICQAINLGYAIGEEIHNLIYWEKSERIFEHLIDKLYDERNKLKAEGNPMEHLCKILLNSLYGKTLEIIKTGSIFIGKDGKKKKSLYFNEPIGDPVELANGQTEHHYYLKHPKELKPVHIGAFILAYARAIMNEIIVAVGPENIAYSDTDSIYVRKSALNKASVKAKMHNGLGGFKNDYGETAVITRAMIVDIKRYLLELKYDQKEVDIRRIAEEQKKAIHQKDPNNLDKLRDFEKAQDKNYFPRLKAKFTGICFKKEKYLQNWVSQGSLSEYENLYAWFIANPGKLTDNKIIQEKWIRTEKDVHIMERAFEFSADPQSRGCWINSEKELLPSETESKCIYQQSKDNIPRLEFYPIGYDFTKKERKYVEMPSIIDEYKKLHSVQYEIRGNRLKSRHLLKHPDSFSQLDKVVDPEKIPNKMFESSFLYADDEKAETTFVFLMEKDFKGNVNYFKTGKYGRTCKVPESDVQNRMTNKTLLITLPQSAYPHGINLTTAETEKIHQEINRLIACAVDKQNRSTDRPKDEQEFLNSL